MKMHDSPREPPLKFHSKPKGTLPNYVEGQKEPCQNQLMQTGLQVFSRATRLRKGPADPSCKWGYGRNMVWSVDFLAEGAAGHNLKPAWQG